LASDGSPTASPPTQSWGSGSPVGVQMPPSPGEYVIRATCDLGPFGAVVGRRRVKAPVPEALAHTPGLQRPQRGGPPRDATRLENVLRRDGAGTWLKVDHLQVQSLTLVDEAGRPQATLDVAYSPGTASSIGPDTPRGPRLSLRDAQGRVRLVIGVDPQTRSSEESSAGGAAAPGVPNVTLLGEDGRPSAVLWVGPEGPELVLCDREGRAVSRTGIPPEPAK
jgi:hypothetical protein